MIPTMIIKGMAGRHEKKIGKKAVEKIETILKKKADELILNATRNADFSGRRIIIEEDIQEI